MDDTVPDAVPAAVVAGAVEADSAPAPPAAAPQVPAAPRVLPSEQLARLADRAAAALVLPVPAVDHERALLAEALARVLDAVEAFTATATKKAYRSDWQRFADWAGRRRFPPLPAPPAVLAHYITALAPEDCRLPRSMVWQFTGFSCRCWLR